MFVMYVSSVGCPGRCSTQCWGDRGAPNRGGAGALSVQQPSHGPCPVWAVTSPLGLAGNGDLLGRGTGHPRGFWEREEGEGLFLGPLSLLPGGGGDISGRLSHQRALLLSRLLSWQPFGRSLPSGLKVPFPPFPFGPRGGDQASATGPESP